MTDPKQKTTGRYSRAALSEVPRPSPTPRQVARVNADQTTDEKLVLVSAQLTETMRDLAGISAVVLKLDAEGGNLASITTRLAESVGNLNSVITRLAGSVERIEKRVAQTERVVGLRAKGNGT